jgi:diguanylate cyclase (GGDEF)-like protein
VVYGHLRIPKFYRFPSTLIVFAISLIPAIHLIRFTEVFAIPEFSFALIPSVSIVLAHIALVNNDENIFIRYARGFVFQYQNEYVLVLNKDDIVVDSNPSAAAWFKSQGMKLEFHSLGEIMESLSAKGAMIKPRPEGEGGTDISLQNDELSLVLNLRIHEMDDKQGNKIGSLAIFSDVSGNRALLDMLEEKAGMDPLTGIANRTAYVGAKNRLNMPGHLPLSVIICDVNGLKAVNDTMGHKHGDKLIQIIAKTLESVCPKSGFLARIGGDEFIILLPMADVEASYLLIDEIREALMLKNEEVSYELSVALGTATKNSETEDLDDIIDIADSLMYENKKRIKES